MGIERWRADGLRRRVLELESALCCAKAQLVRVTDLVRYQRQELHTTGLISDEEYASLVQAPGAVARLESYDETRAALRKAEQERDALIEPGKASSFVDALFRLAQENGQLAVSSEPPSEYLRTYIAQLKQERDACATCRGSGVEYSGVCHCGTPMEDHSVYDNHSATEMTRPCPDCCTALKLEVAQLKQERDGLAARCHDQENAIRNQRGRRQ